MVPDSVKILDSLKRIRELQKRKKDIGGEMERITHAFGLSSAESWAVGCLRLEETYCTKDGRKYGPYGPYYYLYFHRTGKLEKRYLGKKADAFKVRRDAVRKLKQLEVEYKGILKLERQLLKSTA